jgi:hypothetical protein
MVTAEKTVDTVMGTAEVQPDAYIYLLFCLGCHIFSGLNE